MYSEAVPLSHPLVAVSEDKIGLYSSDEYQWVFVFLTINYLNGINEGKLCVCVCVWSYDVSENCWLGKEKIVCSIILIVIWKNPPQTHQELAFFNSTHLRLVGNRLASRAAAFFFFGSHLPFLLSWKSFSLTFWLFKWSIYCDSRSLLSPLISLFDLMKLVTIFPCLKMTTCFLSSMLLCSIRKLHGIRW